MRLYQFCNTGAPLLYFSPTLFSTTLLAASLTSSVDANHLDRRQAPGVVATSSYLRRGYQASAVAGAWVYIDGGQFSYLDDTGQSNYQYSSTLLSLDLSQNWTNATVVLQSTAKPAGLPSYDYPSLWYYDAEDLLYTGFTGTSSGIGVQPSYPLSLWSFKPDGTGSGAWNQVISPNSSVWEPLTRPAASLMAYSPSTALILGGDRAYAEPVSPQTLMSTAVHFDMESLSFTNGSAQSFNATGGIERGGMQFVPSFGPQGLFIAMGGLNGVTYNTTDGLVGLSTVSVFDPAKQEWWNQTTSGSPPSPRVSFCTAGINSTNGTYEIFVYGGYGWRFGADSVQYDTISILTLPAFHWISVPYQPQYPRFAHTCNAIGGSQILSIGGLDPRAKNNLPGPANEYNNSADPFLQGLGIFDMTTMNFSDHFAAAAPPYEQSDVVKQYYAQAQQSYLGDLDPGVAALLQVTHFQNTSTNSTSSNSTSTPSSHPSKTNSGAIAGGTVAGVLVLLIVVACLIIFLKKRKRSQEAASSTVPELPDGKIETGKRVHEMHEDPRPLELNGKAFHELGEPKLRELDDGSRPLELSAQASRELHEQSLQEMEQPTQKIELDAHERREMQA